MPYPVFDFVQTVHVPNATDATNQIVITAPYDLKVVSIQARHRTASSAGTMDLVIAANGVAISAGVSALTAVMSSAGTANTNVNGTLKTAGPVDTVVPKGSSLGLLFAGTLTNLVDLDVTLVLRQLRKF
jgi:hypothetical protein